MLGSVGEPINPEAWNWYHEHVGKGACAIVDTFWQTETGSIVVTPFPGAIETKPGAATVPFFGIETAILDPVSGEVRARSLTPFPPRVFPHACFIFIFRAVADARAHRS